MFIDPLALRPRHGGLADSGLADSGLADSGVAGAGPAGVGQCCPACGVGAATRYIGADVDLGALSNSDLEDRVLGLVAERARADGEYLAALGEMTTRYGAQSAAYQLRQYTRMNSSQAREESRLAQSLVEHDLTATLDALKRGEIQASHAKVIARESPKQHRRSEDGFLDLCRAYPALVIEAGT